MNRCPNCHCSYSATLTRGNPCRLPITLVCGHCICYPCLLVHFPGIKHSNRATVGNKHSAKGSAVDLVGTTRIPCSLCLHQTAFSKQDVSDVIPIVDVYQLGIIQLERLAANMGANMGANKIKLTDQLDTSSEPSLKMKLSERSNLKGSKVGMDCLKEVVDTANLQLDKTSSAAEIIQKHYSTVKSDSAAVLQEVRCYFALLHSILQGKELEVHKQLDCSLQSKYKTLNNIKLLVSQYHLHLCNEIDKAEIIERNLGVTIQHIFKASPESLHYQSFLENSMDILMKMQIKMASHANPDFLSKLKSPLNPVMSLLVDDQQSSNWKGLEDVVADCQRNITNIPEKGDSSSESVAAAQPTLPSSPDPLQLLRTTGGPTLKTIVQKAAGYQTGKKLTGLITHKEPPEHIYLQVHNGSPQALDQLLLCMQAADISPAVPNSSFKLGDYCAAKFSVDGLWYRGLIEMKYQDVFMVYFIDYGNRELTSTEFLRPLDESLYDIPALAVCCLLSKSKYDTLKEFRDELITVKVESVVMGQIGRSLKAPELNLIVSLLSNDSSTSAVETKTVNSSQLKLPVKNQGKKSLSTWEKKLAPTLVLAPVPGGEENKHKIGVTLANFVSPGEFYLRTQDSHRVFVKLSGSLQTHFGSPRNVIHTYRNDLKVGGMYAVEHQGTWYRCRLDTLIKDQVSIFLVDLGLSLVVSDVQLHPLDHRFQEEPFLAVRCSMWGLRPAGHVDRWSRTSHEKMMEVFKMASKCFIQIYNETDGTLFVRFFYEVLQAGGPLECDTNVTTCLNDELMDLGLALRLVMPVSSKGVVQWLPNKLPPMEFDGSVSWIDKEGAVFLHLLSSSNSTNMETIANLLNSYLAKSTVADDDLHWQNGQPCIVR